MVKQVVKGHVVPLKEGYVCSSTPEDIRKLWEELLLNDIKPRLKRLFPHGVNSPQELKTLCDFIVYFLKSPLLMGPIPGAVTPDKLLLAYLITRTDTRLQEGLQTDDVWLLYDFVDKRVPGLLIDVLTLVESDDFRRRLVEAYQKIPADTRPGYNTSSLIVHILLTSAASYSLAKLDLKNEEQLAIIRAAALLHDVGKPISYENHVSEGVSLVKRLLGDIVNPALLNQVISLVEAHHLGDKPGANYIKDADRLVSQIDRYQPLVEKILGDRVRKLMATVGATGSFDVCSYYEWEDWDKLEERYPGEIAKLTEKFVKEAEDLAKDFIQADQVPNEDKKDLKDKLNLYVFDIRSIQSFIRSSEKLSILKARSWLIDAIIHYSIPFRLLEKGYPLESVVRAGGGNVEVLATNKDLEELTEVAEKCTELYHTFREGSAEERAPLCKGLKVVVYSSPIYESYARTMKELSLKAAVRKMLLDGQHNVRLLGLSERCQWCNDNPASETLTDEEPVLLCKQCHVGHRFGGRFCFNKLLDSSLCEDIQALAPHAVRSKKAFEIFKEHFSPDKESREWLVEHAIEIISGEEVRGVKRKRELNYAVLSIDGNLTGVFMSRAISFTDAVERSYRIDLALKQSLRSSLESLAKAVMGTHDAEEAADQISRLRFGIMYMGGDDSLMVIPSWTAIPLAVQLMDSFSELMGRRLTLSIGIAAVPVKHSIWMAIDGAQKLLKIAKKGVGRKNLGYGGAIAYYVMERGMLTSHVVSSRLSSLTSKRNSLTSKCSLGLSRQPYPLYDKDCQVGVITLLQTLLNVNSSDLHAELFKRCWLFFDDALRDKGQGGEAKVIREIRSEAASCQFYALRASKVEGAEKASESFAQAQLIYLARNFSRLSGGYGEQERVEALKRLLKLHGSMGSLPLADIYLLYKLLGGGAA